MNGYKLSNRVCPEGMTLEEWQVALRREAAQREMFSVEHMDSGRIWGDYLVRHGDNSYKVAFRGVESDRNFCSCLDFRTTGLGTCKHIESVIRYLEKEVGGYPWGGLVYRPAYSSIYVSYKGGRSVRFSCGVDEEPIFRAFRLRYFDKNNVMDERFYPQLDLIAAEGLRLSDTFRCYEDVYEYVDEVVAANTWRQLVADAFPNQKMTTAYAQTSEHDEILSELYELLHRGNAIMVGESTQTLRKEVIALASFVLANEEGPVVIVSATSQNLPVWQGLIARSPLAESERVYLFSQEDFDASTRLPSGMFSFFFVENGDVLKDWTNPLSLTIKKISIKHLYIQIAALSKLTPVQFSSITQHISPYLLAPFYRFIRDFRQSFPLSDAGDNLPEKAYTFIFARSATRGLVWHGEEDEMPIGGGTAEIVRNFTESLAAVLENKEACALLIQKLREL